jgi:hypothetical protein
VNQYHHRIKYQWQVERAEEFGVPSQAVRPSEPEFETGPPFTVPGVLTLSRPPGAIEPLPPGETAKSGEGSDAAPRDEDGRGLRSAVYDRSQGTSATQSTVQALRSSGAWHGPGRKSDPGR